MACCFEKAKTSVTIVGRSKVIPCTALICTKAAIIGPAASYSGLSKSSTLKRGTNDGTHVPILVPNENHADYVNRKGYHSIIMQAVVDHSNLYRYVVIGWPGSVHDARVLSNSKIFEKGNNITTHFSHRTWRKKDAGRK